MKPVWKLKCGLLLALCVNAAYADDGTADKIAQLQKMLEQQQAQMKVMADELTELKQQQPVRQASLAEPEQKQIQEQQWQIQAMADELKALQQKPTVVVSEKDGIGLKSSNGDFSIKLHGLFQGDYRGIDAGGTASTSGGWMVRKARPWIEGSLFGWIDYRFTPEFATTTSNVTTTNGNVTLGTPEVIDAFADFKFQPWLKLRAGKFKPFVGLARLQSDTVGKFLEQSMVTANLLPQRDVGASLFGDVFDGKLSYAVGFSNGVIDGGDQSVALDGNNDKEFTARLFAEPFKGQDSILAGLGFGIAGTSNNQRGANTNSSTSQLPSYRSFSQSNFFSYTTTAGSATYADGQRTRWSPQAYYYYGPFGVMAEYAREHQAVTRGTNHKSLNHDAWEVTASYLLTGEKASYGDVKPNRPFKPGSDGWGAWEIVARYNELNIDSDTFVGTNGLVTGANPFANPTTAASSAQGWGIGVNWYLNNYTRFTVDYETTSFDGGGGGTVTAPVDKPDEKAMIGRLQVTF